jgi:hypothetical protein
LVRVYFCFNFRCTVLWYICRIVGTVLYLRVDVRNMALFYILFASFVFYLVIFEVIIVISAVILGFVVIFVDELVIVIRLRGKCLKISYEVL